MTESPNCLRGRSESGDAWHDEARRLRSDGVSIDLIAHLLGRSYSGVYKVLHPDKTREYNRKQNRKRQAAKTAWQREKDRTPDGRARCAECGELCGIGTARGGVARREGAKCRECMRASFVAKAFQVETMWAEGLLMREIAERMGWSMGHLSKVVDQMRREGFKVPHRRRQYKGVPYPPQEIAA